MDQNNGGILGKINTPTTSVASGVWSLDSQFEAQSSSIWPLAFPQTTIVNSCRFDDGSSDYLNKTFGTPTNNDICTLSFWIKKTGSSDHAIWSNGSTNADETNFVFQSSGKFEFKEDVSSSATFQLITNRVFRDSSAWYHIVIAFDTTQSTSSNRVKLYVNGVQETSFSTETYPSQNTNVAINSNIAQYIGRRNRATDQYFDGYLAEMVFVDGQQLLPTSFGVFNTVSNIWEPRGYAGTYGTNGFRLDFADSSALGNDVSGNDNDFTVNNLTSIDQTTDTCSNNFATWNPLVGSNAGGSTEYYPTLEDGNTKATPGNAAQNSIAVSTIGVSSGKWYAEFILISESDSGADSSIGVTDDLSAFQTENVQTSSQVLYSDSGSVHNRASSSSSGTSFSTGDIIGVALDLDNDNIYFSKNGTFINSGSPTSGATGTGAYSLGSGTNEYFFMVGDSRTGGSSVFRANFGNPSASISSGNADANGHGNFEYAVPSGYFALCTKNLAEFGG